MPGINACLIATIIPIFLAIAIAQEYPFTKLLKDNDKDLQWDSTLADQNNQQFQQLAQKVRSKIGLLFINKTGIDDITINTFRPGSVYANFKIALKNNSNITLTTLKAVINATKWIDITSGKQPRTFKGAIIIIYPTWKDSYADTSSGDYTSLVATAKSVLTNLYRRIAGFQEVVILGVKRSDSGTAMEFRVLFDSMSLVLSTELEQMLKTSPTQGSSNQSLQVSEVSVKEENPDSTQPPKARKPTWLLVLIALACVSIFAGIVAFLNRVIRQSCAAPKFKFNEDKATEENASRRPSNQPPRNSTETLTEPHQNCIRPATP